MRPSARYWVALSLSAVLWSCTSSDEQQTAQHVERGDRYAEQRKYAEAVIEYKNAARAAPNDAAIHWKLARAALTVRDGQTSIAELQRVIAIDPSHIDAKDLLGQMYLATGKIGEVARIAERLTTEHGDRATGYILQGRLAAGQGDIASAIARFEEAVQRDPTSFETMMTLGHLYFLQQNPVQAVSWYDRAVKTNPDSIEAYVARGNYFFAVGRPDDGEKDFDRAIALSRGAEDTHLAIAVHHLTQGRPYRAEQELTALAEEMKSRKAQVLLAELKLELGKIAEAKTLVAAVLQHGERDSAALYLEGRLALAEQKRAEARALFEGVVKREPGMAAAHLYLGVLDLVEGRRVAGEEQLREAVKLDPATVKAHLVLAELYLSENFFAKAEQEAFEILRRNPAHVQAAVLYADSFLLRDDWGKAEAVYSALLTQLPQDPIGPTKMALLKQRQGLSSQAAALFGEAVKRSPTDHGLMSEYLLALIAAEQQEKAGRLLRDYLRKGPQDPVRWEVAGRFHIAARHPAQAEEALQKAAVLAPSDSRPTYQLAQLYISQKKTAAAEAALRKALRQDDTFEPAHTSLGLLLASVGRMEEANAEYRRALELRPTNYVAANNLAASLVDQDANLDDALRYGRLAITAAPNSPAVQDTVGWIYFKRGLLDEAYPLLTAAAGGLGDNPAVRYHYAMILARRGEKVSAATELEAALSLSKTFPGAKEAATTLDQLRE
jgi:tetratricopeptide (TPR) repeat protein